MSYNISGKKDKVTWAIQNFCFLHIVAVFLLDRFASYVP